MNFDPKDCQILQDVMYNMNYDWNYPISDVEESQDDNIFGSWFNDLNEIRQDSGKVMFNAVKSSIPLILLAIMIILAKD